MLARITTILKTKRLNQKSAAEIMNISGAKMSKVLSGHQFLSAEAIGLLIKEFNIHPNWLFGFEGNDEEIIYMSSVTADLELAKRDKEIQDLKLELGEVYKQLAEERKRK